ncbi:hypothetical protein FRZ67_10535 [Panacibacter ginsenosidivorans]|uniref:DUF4212 domain-containing protein n=1 Tax=Panacibacter ginsenosidivorans TaxID=1813871 RepID=A0A5B8V897_9BACT|nr:hypothetical protein [Panacibacter ginsenosidivorans]QEC67707.1 hypothetical protein FRZ67_10535 [Panacibacter ginsenosidivorans]
MEPEVREFLKRISLSLGIGLFWMIMNSTLGIMFDFAFVHDGISLGNVIFYIWFILSFAGMLWLYIRLWKKPLEKDINSYDQQQ